MGKISALMKRKKENEPRKDVENSIEEPRLYDTPPKPRSNTLDKMATLLRRKANSKSTSKPVKERPVLSVPKDKIVIVHPFEYNQSDHVNDTFQEATKDAEENKNLEETQGGALYAIPQKKKKPPRAKKPNLEAGPSAVIAQVEPQPHEYTNPETWKSINDSGDLMMQENDVYESSDDLTFSDDSDPQFVEDSDMQVYATVQSEPNLYENFNTEQGVVENSLFSSTPSVPASADYQNLPNPKTSFV